MAELALIGLAGNVVQFVAAAGSLLSIYHQLYKSGSLASNSQIREQMESLDESLNILQDARSAPMDAQLAKLVKRSLRLSKDMASILSDLEVDPSKQRAPQAVLKSFKTVFKKKNIKRIQSELESLRQAICLHLDIMLRNHSQRLVLNFRDLSDLTKTNHDETQLKLDRLAADLKSTLNPVSHVSYHIGELATQLQSFMKEAAYTERVLRVLKGLHFSQIKERFSGIHQAHRETFKWIFDDSSGVNFKQWLSSNTSSTGIYWVTGKPGSGKSTLMKFIQGHSETERLLRSGIGSQDIIIATHYFWSAGTRLQKTQEGLFRTLLFQILSQCTDLISVVASNRWNNKLFADMEEWSYDELLVAFQRLADADFAQKRKICIFVDGLDEFKGDHKQLAQAFCLLAKSPNLKLCLSSRPWQDFTDEFGGSPWTLRVEDLTKNDIKRYIEDILEQEQHYRDLRIRDSTGADRIAIAIRKKAKGVFLWVFLIVRSVIRGLVNHDSIQVLHSRVEELPPELEQYFKLMLDNIETTYRQENARIFRIMLASHLSLPIVVFELLDHDQTNTKQRDADRRALWDRPTTERVIRRQQRQLNASCRDLIHITLDTDKDELCLTAVKVGFLHRTVMDFLRTESIDGMLVQRSGADFDPHLNLCRAYLRMLEVRPLPMHSLSEAFDFEEREAFAAGTLYYAKKLEEHSGLSANPILERLDEQVSRGWKLLVPGGHCESLLDVAVRCGLKLYVMSKVDQLAPEEVGHLLIQALKAEICLEKDDNFRFTSTNTLGISMLRSLLEHNADPNVMPRQIMQSVDPGKVHGLPQSRQGPRPRTVWFDFLGYLAEADKPENPLDMSQHLGKKKRQLPEGSYEACELLIVYGARRETFGDFNGARTLFVYGKLKDIFPPEDAKLLCCQLDEAEESRATAIQVRTPEGLVLPSVLQKIWGFIF
ncbi:hypothetical protein E8E13_003237 [Curvularia kusanoi]|uniref:NACHT domain-containing protein n=1 Tax=Curvularia kusanoi TaxID=90978 RepID=A0A9P4W561_CURKU|nr:hypothetical protein E8E13_003237 [Curvularia kusanoi]